jgi:hypothetical protein
MLLYFVQDKTLTGLKETVIRVFNDYQNANTAAKVLRNTYGYFNWHVILFNSKLNNDEKFWYSRHNGDYNLW